MTFLQLLSARRRWTYLAAALIVVPAIGWTMVATYHATFEPFGRDQGIFQYIAWAVSLGDRAYVQVRDINGPMIPMIHLAFLKLGGADEHVFRSLDFALFGLSALVTGALLPGLGARAGEESPPVTWAQRALWALAGWVVLSAGYLLFGWWEHAQRESFFNDFLMPAVALTASALAPSTSSRRRRAMLGIAGALSAFTWLGKPSCALYSAELALVIVVAAQAKARSEGLAAFAIGCVVGCIPGFVFLLAYGDVALCARTMFLDVTRLHRYIWHKSLVEAYEAWHNGPRLNYAIATILASSVAVALGALPRRFLAFLALPVGGLVNFILQGKGFPYHLHPIVAGTHLVWVAAAANGSERVLPLPAKGARYRAWVLAVGALALGLQSLDEVRLSPAMQNDWYDDRRAAGPDSEQFLRHFTGGDYFAWDQYQAAEYIRKHTRPDDRIQTYAMDPYLMFLAQRRSATPYIYNFELNVDSALEGHPTASDRAWMIDTAKQNGADMLARMQAEPPAAFVAIDRVPYTDPEDADADFAAHCPEAARWLSTRYTLAKRFGTVRVWLRNDRYAAAGSGEARL